MSEQIQFSLDPRCPWCWQTSKWVRQLEAAGVVSVRWGTFSLELQNFDKPLDQFDGARAVSGPALRTLVALREGDGDAAAGRFYAALGERYFGEGIAILGGRLYQITWMNGAAVVYNLDTFEVERTMQYDGEGWGLTHDGKELIMSDGSATIRFRDPQTFAVTREIEVRDNGMPLAMLNELEYIDGEIWANIWYDDRIARISPADGKVLGFIDLSTLYPKSARGSEAVLNGIAYDAAAKRLFVTGKNWPQLYEIEVTRP